MVFEWGVLDQAMTMEDMKTFFVTDKDYRDVINGDGR